MLGIRLPSPAYARVRPGVYVDRVAFSALPSWQRYALRVHALLRVRPDAILCLESAAVVLGLPLFEEPRDLHVYDPDRSASRRFGDIVVHTSVDPRHVGTIAGIATTSPIDTVIDLVRVLPLAQGLAVTDAAVSSSQRGFTQVRTLRERQQLQQNRRGRARARWVWAHADPRAESPGESVSRAVIGWCGFEHPESQRVFRYEGHEDRTDFFFPSVGAVGESDGWGKYELEDPERSAERLRDEKRREDRLRRNGHPVARWDLSDAWRVEPLVRSLRSVGLRPVRPRESAMLAAMAHRPRSTRRSARADREKPLSA
ncbi:hypothetical protein AB0N59_07130 [Microbacterium sp. NPDC089321]|uniref:hypothetical protein n=1 Tax=Microbacterium sp. NPDC089321 TaxID=3155183 RepID=UPI003414BFA2